MDTETYETDVAIIGAGPVGLFAVFQCGMLGLKSHVIDALPEIGGQCTALYPEKPIYDIAGLPSVQAADLIANLEAQAAPFSPRTHLGQQVTGITGTAGAFTLELSSGTNIKAKAIIIAAGAGAFGPNRPPLNGIEAYENSSIFYAVRDKEKFRDKHVMIAGGGDSALDWAIALSDIAQRVSIVHRRDKFRGAPDSVEKLHALAQSGKIQIITPYQLKSVRGAGAQIKSVSIATLDGVEKELQCDALLCFFGLSTDLGPIADWGLELERKEILIDPLTAKTSKDGIYAVGDVATYDKKLKLILTGFAEAAQAAHAIFKQVNPDTELHFEYSTTKGLPK